VRHSGGMRFDTLLTRAESLSLAAEVAALRTPTRVVARGIHQDGSGRGWQFQMVVDEPNKERAQLDWLAPADDR
jgi:hypothetical protein